jgi:hypothetical protein
MQAKIHQFRDKIQNNSKTTADVVGIYALCARVELQTT